MGVAIPVSALPVAIGSSGYSQEGLSNLDKKSSVFSRAYLESWVHYMDDLPPNPLQQALDNAGGEIGEFVKYLLTDAGLLGPMTSVRGAQGIQEILIALPRNALKNILNNMALIIKAISTSLVHPYEGLRNVAALVREICVRMTQPMACARIGAGILGTLTSQFLLKNPYSILLSLIIGSSCIISGVSLDLHNKILDMRGIALSEGEFDRYLERDCLALAETFIQVLIATLIPGSLFKCVFHYSHLSLDQMEQIQTGSFRIALIISNLNPFFERC